MKKLLILLALLTLPILSFAQLSLDNIPIEGDMAFTFYSNNSAEQKLLNTKTWIATSFNDYTSVLQFEDIPNGRIVIKGSSSKWYKYTFTMMFDIKDDRYRIKIEDIKHIYNILDIELEETLTEQVERVNIKLGPDTKEALKKYQKELNWNKAKLQKGGSGKNSQKLILINSELEQKIQKIESEREAINKRYREEIIYKYKTLFYNILKSASEQIAESSDF